MYTTPPRGPIFHARFFHSWCSTGAEKYGVAKISPRAFRRRIDSIRYWHPLGCRAIELANPPHQGSVCEIHRRVRYEVCKEHAHICSLVHHVCCVRFDEAANSSRPLASTKTITPSSAPTHQDRPVVVVARPFPCSLGSGCSSRNTQAATAAIGGARTIAAEGRAQNQARNHRGQR